MDNHIVSLLEDETQQKLIALANQENLSPDGLLNTLLDEELERNRLLKISNELSLEKSAPSVPSQNLVRICNKHLSSLTQTSEIAEIIEAIENLYNELLTLKLLSVNTRKNDIIESRGIKITRVDYYWYGSVIAKYIAMHFGVHQVYLFHELFHPVSEILFIGMPNNVAVCSEIYSQLYRLFKQIKVAYKKDAGKWGNNREMEEAANRYAYEFSYQTLQNIRLCIENENHNKHLYDYVEKKYSWTMR
jgi:hypothetical protein